MDGKVFNSWTVLSFSHKHKDSGNYYYRCQCICGNIGIVSGSNLRQGGSTQCKSCSGRKNGRKALYAKANGDLYFIKCGEYVKIGVSENVERRFRDLESSNPSPLEIIYHGPGEADDEEFWHNVYKHRHHRGEWYHFGGCEI